MSEKHAKASRARWDGVSKEERALRMSKAARARWDKPENKDPAMRRALALKMLAARK